MLKSKQHVTFLEVFYYFGQMLIQSDDNNVVDEFKRRVLIELDNKVVGLKYHIKNVNSIGNLLKKIKKNNNKRVYSYTADQHFSAEVIAYLDGVHSIYDQIKSIDNLIGKSFYSEIKNEEWFKIEMDLRNLFHHIESPLLIIRNNTFQFVFERIHQLNHLRYFNDSMRDASGRITVEINFSGFGVSILSFLNDWAKKHLETIDVNKTIKTTHGFKKDGSFIIKEVSLSRCLDMARENDT